MKLASCLMRLVVLTLGGSMVLVVPAPTLAQTAQPTPAAPQVPPSAANQPQAKTPEELKAYQDALQAQSPAAAEAAANSFAEKFPGSALTYLLYYRAFFGYQNAGNAEDKAIEMGRKIIALKPNDPVALAMVASLISEHVSNRDLDRDLRLAEVLQDAQKALQTVDTETQQQPGMSAEQFEQSKKTIRSTAYAALGNVYLLKNDPAQAEDNFKKALELYGDKPDPVILLRYAVALDRQKKYKEGLDAATKAVALSPAGSAVSTMATQERDRLQQFLPASATTKP